MYIAVAAMYSIEVGGIEAFHDTIKSCKFLGCWGSLVDFKLVFKLHAPEAVHIGRAFDTNTPHGSQNTG